MTIDSLVTRLISLIFKRHQFLLLAKAPHVINQTYDCQIEKDTKLISKRNRTDISCSKVLKPYGNHYPEWSNETNTPLNAHQSNSANAKFLKTAVQNKSLLYVMATENICFLNWKNSSTLFSREAANSKQEEHESNRAS